MSLAGELRSWADYLGSTYDGLDTHLLTAADEIERLRDGLHQLRGVIEIVVRWEHGEGWGIPPEWWLEVAKRALKDTAQ